MDIQDISITVTTTKSKKEVQFELSDENESTINTEDFSMFISNNRMKILINLILSLFKE